MAGESLFLVGATGVSRRNPAGQTHTARAGQGSVARRALRTDSAFPDDRQGEGTLAERHGTDGRADRLAGSSFGRWGAIRSTTLGLDRSAGVDRGAGSPIA